MRRMISLVALLFALVGPACASSPVQEEAYCAFCDPKVLDAQTFYEDELVLALYTHKPIFPGHCLIIPKRHVPRFEGLTDQECLHIAQTIRKVNLAVSKVFGTSSYLLLQKNGEEVGQSVPHVHFHYIPRMKGDDSTLKFFWRMYFVNMQGPIDPQEMKETVSKLKEAIDLLAE
ncbi:MAG: HIT family protein [Chlamydiales bacterium]|nr:HIT family protein [Chlamydiales bacterium]